MRKLFDGDVLDEGMAEGRGTNIQMLCTLLHLGRSVGHYREVVS